MKLLNTLTKATAGLLLSSCATTALACSPDGYLATMNVFAGNFAIRGCALAQGQILSISQNTALFSLMGTTYGGDGRTSFGLPDTRGRSVIGAGTGPGLSTISLGQKGGAENKVLSTNNLPAHNHAASTTVNASATARANSAEGGTDSPNGNSWAVLDRENLYSSAAPDVSMHAGSISISASAVTTTSNTGNGTSFSIRDPYIGMNWMIQTQGVFPSRN